MYYLDILSGGEDYEKALQKLVDKAKELATGTGSRGLTPRNAYREGRLQEMVDEIGAKEKQIRDSEEVAQELHQKQRERENLQEQMQSLDSAMGELEGRLKGL